jgi:hypothetical protein
MLDRIHVRYPVALRPLDYIVAVFLRFYAVQRSDGTVQLLAGIYGIEDELHRGFPCDPDGLRKLDERKRLERGYEQAEAI